MSQFIDQYISTDYTLSCMKGAGKMKCRAGYNVSYVKGELNLSLPFSLADIFSATCLNEDSKLKFRCASVVPCKQVFCIALWSGTLQRLLCLLSIDCKK